MGRKNGKLLGVSIDSTDRQEVLDYAWKNIQKNKKFFIITPNPEILVRAYHDAKYLKILNSADYAICDGVGLTLASKLLYGKPINRLTGRAMFEHFLSLASQKNLKVYLLGSTPGVISNSLEKIRKNYAGIRIQGQSGPLLDQEGISVDSKNRKLEQSVLTQINSFKPDLVFVGFGAPKQEKWVARNIKSLRTKGVMVIGGSLDSFSGSLPPPPGFIARMGLEWLWRLILEPKRIKRIFTAVLVFPFLVIKEKLRESF